MKSNKIIRYLLIVSLIICTTLMVANYQTKKTYDAKSKEYNDKIAEINTKIDTLYSTITALDNREKSDISVAGAKINNVANNFDKEVSGLNKSISDINTKIMNLQNDLAALKSVAVTTTITETK